MRGFQLTTSECNCNAELAELTVEYDHYEI